MSEEDDMSSPVEETFEPIAVEDPVPRKQIPLPEENSKSKPKLPKISANDLLKENTPLSFNVIAVLAASLLANSSQLYSCFGVFGEKLNNKYVHSMFTILIYVIIVIGYKKFVSK